MNLLMDLAIKTKIMAIALLAILSISIIIGYNFIVTSGNNELVASVRDVDFPVLEHLDSNIQGLAKIDAAGKAAVQNSDVELLENAEEAAWLIETTYSEIVELDPRLSIMVDKLKALHMDYYTVFNAAITGMITQSIPPDQVGAKLQKMQQAYQAYGEALSHFRHDQYEHFTESIATVTSRGKDAVIIGLTTGILAIIFILYAAIFISGLISRNISHVVDALTELSEGAGDLTRRLKVPCNDEVGKLVLTFNSFVEKLQEMIGDLAKSTTQLTNSAQEVNNIAEVSEHGNKKQQLVVEQVVTAIDQMSATVKDVAKNAVMAQTATEEANLEGQAGRVVVKEAIDSIGSLASEVHKASGVINNLEKDSDNVGAILGVIRGITEQTNLLALNAAIEAARAGDQGRGFAVVADEVRVLANRIQDSTLEIQDLIQRLQSAALDAVSTMNQGVSKAETSVSQVTEAAASLESIADRIDTISKMNTQIAFAAEEQGAVTDDIQQNIVSIHNLSAETAEGAKKTANSSEELLRLAGGVQTLVDRFKV